MRRCSGRNFSAWFSLSGLLKGFAAAAAVKVGGESLAFIICKVFCTSVAPPKPERPFRWRRGSQPSSPSPSPPFRRLSPFISHSGRKSVSLSSEDGLISGSLLPGELAATRAHPAGAKCRTSPAASQPAAQRRSLKFPDKSF